MRTRWLWACLCVVVSFGLLPASGASSAEQALPPGPVTNVTIDASVDDGLLVDWLLPPDADGAVVCLYYKELPQPAVKANGCSAVVNRSYRDGWPEDPPIPSVVIYSYNSATGLFGPAAFDTGEPSPPFGPGMVTSHGINDTSLQLAFYGDDGGGSTTWVVRQAVGRSEPDLSTAPIMELPVVPRPELGPHVVHVTGLSPNTVYTFSVQGRDARGNVSERVEPHTTVTRSPGSYVQENRRASRGPVTSAAPQTAIYPSDPSVINTAPVDSSIAVDPATGRVHLAYLAGEAKATDKLLYTSRLPDGDWEAPTLLARTYFMSSLVRSRRGTLVASWDNCWRVKRVGRAWGAPTCLRGMGDLTALIDRNDRLHILTRSASGLHYRTNALGRWTTSRVVGDEHIRQWIDIDPVTDRIVLVLAGETTYPKWRVQVATKTARSARFGRLHTRASGAGQTKLMPTSVTAYNGRITVGAQLLNRFDKYRYGAPRVMTGGSAATLGAPVAVPGTTLQDGSFLVSAASKNRVLFAWTHRGADTRIPDKSVTDPASGVWATRAARVNGRWVFEKATQRTTNAFDEVMDLASDTKGATYVNFRRIANDQHRLQRQGWYYG